MQQAKWAIKFNPKSKIGRNKALMQFMITSCIQEKFPATCIKQALITRPAFFGCSGESVLHATELQESTRVVLGGLHGTVCYVAI